MKRNTRYILPDNLSYAEIAAEVAELREQGRSWPDIVALYQESSPEIQASYNQWDNLLHNALYRSGIKVQAHNKPGPILTGKAEQERIKAIKAAYSATNHTPATYTSEYLGESHLRIGIVSDTHFGSKWSQYSALRQFYDVCAAAGVTDIYHAGDLDDGSDTMHVGVVNEHHVVGANKHIDNIIANYPHIDGIVTHFITGNHDASFGKNCGLEIGPMVAERRPDMHYLGRDIAHVQLTPNCKMELRHPGDGSAYALSYKLQKLLETYDWSDHPDIVIVGHYHKYVTMYHRGMLLMHPGCFQALTDFMRAKLGYAAIGGVILDIALDTDGRMVAVTPTWVPYREIKDDYKNLPRD